MNVSFLRGNLPRTRIGVASVAALGDDDGTYRWLWAIYRVAWVDRSKVIDVGVLLYVNELKASSSAYVVVV